MEHGFVIVYMYVNRPYFIDWLWCPSTLGHLHLLLPERYSEYWYDALEEGKHYLGIREEADAEDKSSPRSESPNDPHRSKLATPGPEILELYPPALHTSETQHFINPKLP